MNKKECSDIITGPIYYSEDDLRYNQKLGYLFSKDKYNDFLDMKETLIEENCGNIKVLPLKTFNSKYCFYVEGEYLLTKQLDYLKGFVEDFQINKKSLSDRNITDILLARVFSEVEGTLNIENVPTTHKRIKQVFNAEKLTDKNDIIIKNMYNALTFIIQEKPEFNKDNLLKLYKILSKDCLSEDCLLKDGEYYRDDEVSVGGFDGADCKKIPELMESLFDFVKNYGGDRKNVQDNIYLPHICHYYILYVHPYFDYNGRTARMVSFWITYLYGSAGAPLFISEAINEQKRDYYRALINTRTTRNDLTYFLGYIVECSIKFSYVYKNIEEIKKMTNKTGNFLTSTELTYLKKIIIHNPEDYFNCKMFFGYINGTMSKQAGFKILNRLADYDILLKSTNKKKEIIYKVNPEFITYKYPN